MLSDSQAWGVSLERCLTVGFWFQGIGDIQLAYQCFRLALASNNDHAEAYNNLGVLEMRKGHTEQVKPGLWLVQLYTRFWLGEIPSLRWS